jgi:hypothetical protein
MSTMSALDLLSTMDALDLRDILDFATGRKEDLSISPTPALGKGTPFGYGL